jgi:hypothetical protein
VGAAGAAALRSGRPTGSGDEPLKRVALSRASLLRWRRGILLCFAAALAVYGLEAIAWPLHGGRDSATYLIYYADMWSGRPLYPELMLYRTPLAPLVFGPLLDFGGAATPEAVMGIAFALSVVAVASAAALLRRSWGVATAVALLLWPDYGELFREVSSDSVFAFVFALWTYLVVRVALRPSSRGFVAVGAGVALLVLARPAGQALVLVMLLPLLLAHAWSKRVLWAGLCGGAAIGLLAGWAGVNLLRYGDFTVSRTVSAQLPLNRLFVNDRIVSPNNGPRSRELADAVRDHLLPREPYRSYGITLDEFFSSGSFRMYSDLIPLSDQLWGWSSDYAKLRAVGLETVRAHPLGYVRGVYRDVYVELRLKNPTPAPQRPSGAASEKPEYVTVDGRRLPKPSEGELIPRSAFWWLFSTPDGRLWIEDTIAGNVHFRERRDEEHARRLDRDTARLVSMLPARNGSAEAAAILERLSRWYPAMLFWIVAGIAGFAARRGRDLRIPGFLTCLALAVVVATALSQTATAEYRLPFDPIFVLFGVAGVLGRSDPISSLDRLRRRGRASPSRAGG